MNCILKGLWLCSKIDGGSEKFIWQVYDKLLLSGKKKLFTTSRTNNDGYSLIIYSQENILTS